MKKGYVEKFLYIFLSALFPLMIFLALILLITKAKVAFALFMLGVTLIGFMLVILFFKPYICNFMKAKNDRYEYKNIVVSNMLNGCISAKIAGLPILILLSTMAVVLGKVLQGIGLVFAMIMFPILPLLLIYGTKIGMMALVAVVFSYSFYTSIYGINALIFMMWNKRIKVIWGVLGILILMMPLSDLLIVILLKANERKVNVKMKPVLLAAVIPFLISVSVLAVKTFGNISQANSMKKISKAAEQNNTAYVEKMLGKGHYKFTKDDHINTPVINAVKNQSVKMVKSLLEKGADANESDVNGDSVLSYACLGDSNEIIELLIKYKAKINDERAFYGLIRKNNISMLQQFEKLGADFNTTGEDNNTALIRYCQSDGGYNEAFSWFSKKCDVNHKNRIGATALTKYCSTNTFSFSSNIDEKIIKALLDAGADKSAKDNYDNRTAYNYIDYWYKQNKEYLVSNNKAADVEEILMLLK